MFVFAATAAWARRISPDFHCWVALKLEPHLAKIPIASRQRSINSLSFWADTTSGSLIYGPGSEHCAVPAHLGRIKPDRVFGSQVRNLQRRVRAVAERPIGRIFATAENHSLRFSSCILNWGEFRIFVRAVAKRLIPARTTRAPEVSLPCLDRHCNWCFLRDNWFAHRL